MILAMGDAVYKSCEETDPGVRLRTAIVNPVMFVGMELNLLISTSKIAACSNPL